MHVPRHFSPIPTFSFFNPYFILDHYSSLVNENEDENNNMHAQPHHPYELLNMNLH